MFNLKKKTQTALTAISSAFDPELITAEQVHNDFYSAGDNLVKYAETLLDKRRIEKANRLSAVGFECVEEVKSSKNIADAQELARLWNYYKLKYPLYKFISNSDLYRLCKKYNLYERAISKYKGFVPEKNLLQIEKFKVDQIDLGLEYSVYYSYNRGHGHAEPITREEFLERKFPDRIKPVPDEFSFYSNEQEMIGLKICAPAKDIQLGYNEKLENNKIIVVDPLVIQSVRGGFLIVTAWGDEASDPEVINEINN